LSLDAVEATVVHVHFIVVEHVVILVEFVELVLRRMRRFRGERTVDASGV
jgi:hypothetical protein